MTAFDFGAIDPNTKNGTELASDLNSFRDAQNTLHSGTSRPAYAQAGTMWLNTTTTTWGLNVYDGADDIKLFDIDTTENTAVFTGSTLALSGSGTGTSLSVTRTGVPVANLALFHDDNAGNDFSNVEILADHPGLVLRDETTDAMDFRLGVDVDFFKVSIDTDDDAAKDGSGHFDNFTNALVVEGATGNVGFGREPTVQLDFGLGASGADVRFLAENTSDTASATTTVQIKAGGTNAGAPALLFTQGAVNFGWAIDRTINSGSNPGFVLFSGTDPLLDANQVITVEGGNVGIGTISAVTNEIPASLFHLAASNEAVVASFERVDTSMLSGDILGEFDFIGGEDATPAVVAKMVVQADGAWLSGQSPTSFSFWTTPGASETVLERIVISNLGQLGVFSNEATVEGHTATILAKSTTQAVLTLEREDATVTKNTIIGQINFRGGEDGSEQDIGQIRGEADADWTSGGSPTRISFWTTPAGSETAVERMVLGSDGTFRVIAGNTSLGAGVSPDARLEVGTGTQWSSANFGANIVISGTRNNVIGFLDSGGNNPWAMGSKSTGNFEFATMPALGDTGTPPVTRLALSSGGDLVLLTGDVEVAVGNLDVTAGNLTMSNGDLTLFEGKINATSTIIPTPTAIFTQTTSDPGRGGVVRIIQNSDSADNPVLSLQQDNLSEEFIKFITTIGVGNPVEAIAAKSLSTTHFIKVQIPGDLDRYIPVGTIA